MRKGCVHGMVSSSKRGEVIVCWAGCSEKRGLRCQIFKLKSSEGEDEEAPVWCLFAPN